VSGIDPTNVVGVYQQDRWSNGGAHGLVDAVSHDGGQTWPVHSWAHFSTCSGGTAANGGDFDRASDPWVTLANGHAYFMSLSASTDLRTSAMLVAKSTDGGEGASRSPSSRSPVNEKSPRFPAGFGS
jgi:hypothetical protein